MGKQVASTIGILNTSNVAAIPIASTAVVYTKSFKFGSAESYALKYKADSSGTVNLKIELEISDVEPTTEGSADTTNYAVPENFADIESAYSDAPLLNNIRMVYKHIMMNGGRQFLAVAVFLSALTLAGLNSGNKVAVEKVRRNAPCPCGSGKKYKRCCLS